MTQQTKEHFETESFFAMGRKETFIKSGLILSGSALIMRTAGMAFNVYLSAKIGAEGMGLYSLILSAYGFAVTFGSAGIHLAATRMTAEAAGRGESPKRSMTVCILYGIATGLTASVLLLLLSSAISSSLLQDPRTLRSIRILSASLPFIAVSSAFGGFFTAIRKVSRSAAAQIFEQIVKIILIVSGLIILNPGNAEYSCVIIVAGSTISEISSCLLSAAMYAARSKSEASADISGNPAVYHNIHITKSYSSNSSSVNSMVSQEDKHNKENSSESVLRRPKKPSKTGLTDPIKYHALIKNLLTITIPVSIGSCIRSGLITVEHILIPMGLRQSGASASTALASYGVLHGMALPVIFFPSAFLTAFAGLIIPELAEAKERGNKKEISFLVNRMLAASLLFSVGVAGALIYFSKSLGILLYGSEEAAYYIKIISPLIPIMYIDTTVDAMLKGLGYQRYNMVINILDAGISVALVYILLPRYGINGYVPVIFITETFNTVCSITKLLSTVPIKFSAKNILCPLIAVTGSASAVHVIFRLLGITSPSVSALVTQLLIFTLIYLIFSEMLFGGGTIMSKIIFFGRIRRQKKPKPQSFSDSKAQKPA